MALSQSPAGHGWQTSGDVAATTSLAVPAGHDVHDDAPGPLHDPTPHDTQLLTLLAPIALLAVPAGHTEHDDDPADDHDPA